MNRRWWVALIVSVLVAGGGIGALAFRSAHREEPTADPLTVAAAVVAELREQRVTTFRAGWFNAGEMMVDAAFTVTADGDVSGTIDEAFAGRADYVAGDGRVAVRGDRAFWQRHSPKQVSALRDRWVQPDDGGFPVRVAERLDRDGLADVVQRVTQRGGAVATDDDSLTAFAADGWTVHLTRQRPYRLVWLGGPMDVRRNAP